MTENWRNPSPILKIPQQMVDTAPCLNVSALKQCRAYRALTSTCSVNRFDEVVPLSGRVDAESHIYTRRVARKKTRTPTRIRTCRRGYIFDKFECPKHD